MEVANLKTDSSENVINTAYKGFKDGSVNFIGDQVKNLTGYSKDVFNSKKIKWLDIVVDEDKALIQKIFVDALKNDKNYMRKYRVRKKDGKVIWIQEWGQIVCDEKDEIEFVTGILLDITKQKNIEEENLKVEALTGDYLIFKLEKVEYGINISKIKEIINAIQVRKVPHLPFYIKGVLNLRGKVIPVVDLGLKFGLEEKASQDRSCIIIVEIKNIDGRVMLGLVVDTVSEVRQIKGKDIENKPTILEFDKKGMILGMAKIKDSVIIILDVDRLLIDEELSRTNQSI